MAKVSFSQYSMWSSCPHQYKLNYIDKLGESSSNIHTIFGTAMHETIQHYLSVMYGVSKKQADEINKDKLLLENMRNAYKSEVEKMSEGTPCTQIQLEEFYGDGRRILAWLDKHMHKFYSKSGFELVGIEIPLNATIKEGVHFIGFIDIVIRDLASNEIIIIDLKTSTMGWNQYQKADKMKNSQILLYKKYYSELFNIPLIFAVALLSFAHGANDVANAIGPLVAINEAIQLGGTSTSGSWIMILGATGLVLGLMTF